MRSHGTSSRGMAPPRDELRWQGSASRWDRSLHTGCERSIELVERDAQRHAGPAGDLVLGRRTVLGGVIAAAAAGIAGRLGAPAAIAAQDTTPTAQDAPLPSWNDGRTKQAILDFVAAATDEGNDGFVPVEDRIATFDQDGCLWVEHPSTARPSSPSTASKYWLPIIPSGRRPRPTTRSSPATRRRLRPLPSRTGSRSSAPPMPG